MESRVPESLLFTLFLVCQSIPSGITEGRGNLAASIQAQLDTEFPYKGKFCLLDAKLSAFFQELFFYEFISK